VHGKVIVRAIEVWIVIDVDAIRARRWDDRCGIGTRQWAIGRKEIDFINVQDVDI
jgi:hypothetical protein